MADKHHDHEGHHDHSAMVADFRRRFWWSLLLTIPILGLSPSIASVLGAASLVDFAGSGLLLFGLATAVFFYGGWPFLTGLKSELASRNPGMMTLIGVAIIVAYGYSSLVLADLSGDIFFWELATLIDVMLLGHWLEMRSVLGASAALEELGKLLPAVAHKLTGGHKTTDVRLDTLKVGDKVIVKPGEKIPADGNVTEGASTVNEAVLTGESKPVSKTVGDEVIGGAINNEGSLTVKIGKVGEDSFLAQVRQLVQAAQASKSKTQDLTNRAAALLTMVALGVGLVTLLGWLLLSGRPSVFAIERTVAVIVITCPHALGLAIPLVVAVSTSLSARRGLLIRNRDAFERVRGVDAVVFDKTGTLSEGTFKVEETVTRGNYDKRRLLELAASLESRSEHPIGAAIAAEVAAPQPVKEFKALSGEGVRGIVEGLSVAVVSPAYAAKNKLSRGSIDVDRLTRGNKTTVLVLVEDKVEGAVVLADKLRPQSQPTIERLKKLGIKTIMITGDNEAAAQAVASELELDDYFANVLPAKKSASIERLRSQGLKVAMVGDGVNDAPALAAADVGIAIGAGADVAIETADIILVRNNPADVLRVIELARATYRKMIENLVWATGYNVFAIPLAAGALLWAGLVISPAVGAALMSASTVVVAVNAKLLKVPDSSEAQT